MTQHAPRLQTHIWWPLVVCFESFLAYRRSLQLCIQWFLRVHAGTNIRVLLRVTEDYARVVPLHFCVLFFFPAATLGPSHWAWLCVGQNLVCSIISLRTYDFRQWFDAALGPSHWVWLCIDYNLVCGIIWFWDFDIWWCLHI